MTGQLHQPSHVAFVNTSQIWGGGEKWHFDSALDLHRQGWQVTLFCYPRSELDRLALSHGMTTQPLVVKSLSFLNPIKFLLLANRFKQLQIQTLIFNSPREMKLVAPAAALANIERIIFRRGLPRPISDQAYYRWIFRHCITQVIANSKEIARSLNDTNPNLVPQDAIHVIYNGLDFKTFDEQSYSPLVTRRPGEVVLATAGRLVKQKNQQVLLDVASQLKDNGLQFRLLIAGVGPLEKLLMQRCQELGLEEQVQFVGYVDNIKDLLASCDMFVLPSLYEGSAHVLLEASAFRLPVVAFDISSNPELVLHEQTGLLAPENDIETMASHIIRLSQDQRLREQMGQAGRALVADKFNEQQASTRFSNLLSATVTS